jgi:transposase
LIADGSTARILATDFGHGSQHDFLWFNQSDYSCSEPTGILADAGYQGLAKLHPNSQTPSKKSQLHPLIPEPKANNRTLSRKRILVENIFRKLKSFRILSERYRNRRTRFSLRFNLLSALYNLHIQLLL